MWMPGVGETLQRARMPGLPQMGGVTGKSVVRSHWEVRPDGQFSWHYTGAMSLRILRFDDSRRQPWANGAGSTRELMQWPGEGQAWQWRLSIADVDRDAPFSEFPGVDRILVLLSGEGLILRFAGGDEKGRREERLDTPFALARFPGEAELSGGPIDGPTTDFNLMWRRDRFDAELWVRPMVGSLQLFASPGETWALHVVAGHVDGDDGLHLGAGDTLVSSDDGSTRHLRLEGAGTALLVRLQERQQTRADTPQ